MSGSWMRTGAWWRRAGVGGLALVALCGATPRLQAQSCVTQAKMTPGLRDTLEAAAMVLADAVKANDTAKIQALTVKDYAGNFGQTAFVVRTTAEKLTNDTLKVTQLYRLDAHDRKAGDTAEANFSCALTGSTSETDFSVPSLPPGVFAFAMVEATGDRPWLLAFLLQQEGGEWKMAGFFPRARAAAGHNGLWFWNAAREDQKGGRMWLAWLLFGEADELLRPANFVTSTNLDGLRSEQRAATPPELSDGIGPGAPLVVKGAAAGTGAAAEFRFTGIAAEGSEDGRRLNLMLHLDAEPLADAAAAKARNLAAAKALLDAHKELRSGFDGVWVFAESSGHDPFVSETPMAQVP